MRRRVKNTALVLVSQMLLVAMAVAWVIHMAIIAAFGSISFVENNKFILWVEILASSATALFGIYVLIAEIKRLGERRSADRLRDPSPLSPGWGQPAGS